MKYKCREYYLNDPPIEIRFFDADGNLIGFHDHHSGGPTYFCILGGLHVKSSVELTNVIWDLFRDNSPS